MNRKKRSIIWSISTQEFKKLVSKSHTIADILRYFGMNNKGGNHHTVKRRAKEENIDLSHIALGKSANKGKRFPPKKTDEEYFTINGTTNRGSIKGRIIRNNLIPYECAGCGLKDMWNNKKISLQLEHKNGIPNDNRLENLCFLCPNCHSQTDTYAGKRFKKPKPPKKDRRVPRYNRRKADRPSKEELEKLINLIPMSSIAKTYNVSDNSVRKWAKSYGIELKNKRGYWQKFNSRARI
jgi:5-methylcytosine-specific restriction endonuclease McrA